MLLSIEDAFKQYQEANIDGWALQDVIEAHGFYGFTVTDDNKLLVHTF